MGQSVQKVCRCVRQVNHVIANNVNAPMLFDPFEGGAIICPDAKTKNRIDQLKNFGFVDEVTVVAPGINGKMSEFNAALGLLQLKRIDHALARRREVGLLYLDMLKDIPGIRCVLEACNESTNYSYFPILVDESYSMSRDALYQKLRTNDIWVRRYFYPLISDFPMYRGLISAHRENLPTAVAAANKVLCLPIYPELSNDSVKGIVNLIENPEL